MLGWVLGVGWMSWLLEGWRVASFTGVGFGEGELLQNSGWGWRGAVGRG